MGFFFLLLIILSLTVIFLIIWLKTKNKIYGKIIGYLWCGLVGLLIFGTTTRILTKKKKLKKNDYYGEYIVDRNYFKGKQTDWQYEHFRFEIKENDSIYFYWIEKNRILKKYQGAITTVKPYNSERIIINMEEPTHHIIKSNPTIYRSAWGFYLVFKSQKFRNVFFKKGKWKQID